MRTFLFSIFFFNWVAKAHTSYLAVLRRENTIPSDLEVAPWTNTLKNIAVITDLPKLSFAGNILKMLNILNIQLPNDKHSNFFKFTHSSIFCT